MRSWKELEASFREIAPSLLGARVDVQWGAAGIYCRLAGGGFGPNRHRFETLATVAGGMLRRHPAATGADEILSAATDFDAWALGLKRFSPAFKFGMIAEQTTASGESGGLLYTGSVSDAPDACANLCLNLEAEAAGHHEDELLRLTQSSGAAAHLSKAYNAMHTDPPDWTAVAREAISALEGAARVVCEDSTATLGDCIKLLRKRRTLHAGLIKALEGVWGFTNESPGIRHGSSELPTISQAEARFVLSFSESGIQLLLSEQAG